MLRPPWPAIRPRKRQGSDRGGAPSQSKTRKNSVSSSTGAPMIAEPRWQNEAAEWQWLKRHIRPRAYQPRSATGSMHSSANTFGHVDGAAMQTIASADASAARYLAVPNFLGGMSAGPARDGAWLARAGDDAEQRNEFHNSIRTAPPLAASTLSFT
ncbi:hypothetical protein Purlil1_12407 [Purpureocillium lilacinum]|uniref:Uncharacterized protein n=1 Tax=Purpureocillium lilacinum TaxID=33203 RepID=A0ABR0BGY8_PURLI|nr:hypothetical protein Purlil1_12407 [Purpureocillium lilacinum]